jgi:hypothetical protein
VASTKTYRFIEAEDVERVFDDACMDRLAKIAELLNTADRRRFDAGVRDAARIYAEDVRKPNVNAVHDEFKKLYQPVSACDCEQVAVRIERLSPQLRELFETREARPAFKKAGLKFPSAEDLRAPDRSKVACDVVRRFCSMGQGPRQHPLLFAPARIRRPARREAELRYVTNLRLALLEATGSNPQATVNPSRPDRPLAKFVRECLILVGASHADAVGLINELNRRGKALDARPNQMPVPYTPKAVSPQFKT